MRGSRGEYPPEWMSVGAPSIRTSPGPHPGVAFCRYLTPLLAELRAAKTRQAAERLALGESYADLGYVVRNEAGEHTIRRR